MRSTADVMPGRRLIGLPRHRRPVRSSIFVNRKEDDMDKTSTEQKTEFEALAQEKRPSLLSEFVFFVKDNKKWWLIPILLVIAFLALLTFFAGTGAAPFIYTLF